MQKSSAGRIIRVQLAVVSESPTNGYAAQEPGTRANTEGTRRGLLRECFHYLDCLFKLVIFPISVVLG